MDVLCILLSLQNPLGKFWLRGMAPPSRSNMIQRAKIIYSVSPTNTHICENYQIVRIYLKASRCGLCLSSSHWDPEESVLPLGECGKSKL